MKKNLCRGARGAARQVDRYSGLAVSGPVGGAERVLGTFFNQSDFHSSVHMILIGRVTVVGGLEDQPSLFLLCSFPSSVIFAREQLFRVFFTLELLRERFF